jgi:hypothetical protein
LKRWPPLGAPALNGGFVALGGSADRLLGTPPSGAQQPTDMIGVVANAKLLSNDCRDALGGPDLTEKAEGFGTPGEQTVELCTLLGAQPGRGAGRQLAV